MILSPPLTVPDRCSRASRVLQHVLSYSSQQTWKALYLVGDHDSRSVSPSYTNIYWFKVRDLKTPVYPSYVIKYWYRKAHTTVHSSSRRKAPFRDLVSLYSKKSYLAKQSDFTVGHILLCTGIYRFGDTKNTAFLVLLSISSFCLQNTASTFRHDDTYVSSIHYSGFVSHQKMRIKASFIPDMGDACPTNLHPKTRRPR